MNPIDMAILGGLALGVMICLVLILNNGGKRKKAVGKRIDGFRRYQTGSGGVVKQRGASSVKREQKKEKAWLALVIGVLPKREILERLLVQTGKNLTISYLLLMVFGISIGTFIVTDVIIGLPLPLTLALSFASGPAVMGLMIKSMIAKRTAAFLKDFPDAIDLMVRGLKAGLPIGESIASVGREFQGPIAEEFHQITEAIRIGTSMNDAMWQACDRMPVQDLKFFVISLSIQQETGGNLGETLGNLANILRRRKTMKLKIKALSSEARASATILGSLPFVLFGIIMLVQKDYAMMLIEDPRGQKAAAIGVVLIAIAIATMAKMIKFKI